MVPIGLAGRRGPQKNEPGRTRQWTLIADIERGQLKPEVGKTVKIGRLGGMTIESENNTFLNDLLVFDKSNIEKYERSSDLSGARHLFNAAAATLGKRPSSRCGQRGVSQSRTSMRVNG
jgi:hypothetical protein